MAELFRSAPLVEAAAALLFLKPLRLQLLGTVRGCTDRATTVQSFQME